MADVKPEVAVENPDAKPPEETKTETEAVTEGGDTKATDEPAMEATEGTAAGTENPTDADGQFPGEGELPAKTGEILGEGMEIPGEGMEIPGEGMEIPGEGGEYPGEGGVLHEEVGSNSSLLGSVQEFDEEEDEEGEEEIEAEEEEPEYQEPEVDPTAPLNLTDSAELERPPFKLRDEQLAEVKEVWDLFQDYTYVYAEIDNYVTIKELRHMMEALLLMTYTEEQFFELLEFCVRPPDPEGWEFTKITYEQFLHMVIIRWRDFNIEEELRTALRALDDNNTGELHADYLRDLMCKKGNKLTHKIVENFIKEVDLAGEGNVGIEDIVGICTMDLQTEEYFAPKMPEDYKQEKKPEEQPGEGGGEAGTEGQPPEAAPDDAAAPGDAAAVGGNEDDQG